MTCADAARRSASTLGNWGHAETRDVAARLRHAFLPLAVLCVAAALATPACGADDKDGKKPKPKPEKYPDIELSEGSVPHYAAVAMDSWDGEIAYLLFDGTVGLGFKKLYVWIPEDRKYGTPQGMTPNQEGAFPAFGPERPVINEDEKSMVKWRFRQSFHKRAAGSSSHRDYVTGQTVTRSWQASQGYSLAFAVDFAHGNKRSAITLSHGLPMDVTISGSFGTQTDWKKIGGGFAPWTSLAIDLNFQRAPAKDPKNSIVSFDSRGLSYGNTSCQVRSVPDDGRISLVISPYLDPPVYSNAVTLAEVADGGLSAEIPYGWYGLRASKYKCGKYIYPVRVHGVGRYPFPLSMPPRER